MLSISVCLYYGLDLESHVTKILEYCRASHNGDRALVDYRYPLPSSSSSVSSSIADEKTSADGSTTGSGNKSIPLATLSAAFQPTVWTTHHPKQCNVSDTTIDEWIHDGTDIIDTPGSFERFVNPDRFAIFTPALLTLQ
jgi:hypothetical protein